MGFFPELEEAQFTGTDSLYVNNVLPLYFRSLRLAKTTNDYTEADELLESLKVFNSIMSEVLPSQDRIQTEITYNKYDIFKKLFSWYLYVGFVFFVLLIVQIFKDGRWMRLAINFFKGATFFLFALIRLSSLLAGLSLVMRHGVTPMSQ